MYGNFELVRKFIHYYLTASNGKGHGMHSPFVFQFITDILNDKNEYPDYRKVEELRKQLLKDQALLPVEEMGAGSRNQTTSSRSIASIARHAAKPRKLAQLLYRIARYYEPDNIIELGTSLGITTSYLSLARPTAKINTLEGSESIADKAKEHFEKLGLHNINLIRGHFDDTLGPALNTFSKIDLAFIDGNHRYEPTMRYFHQLLEKKNNDTIMIFDDIHWSAEMERAWGEIQEHPDVRCSIDLFFIGLVFFKAEIKEKQRFKIRF